MTEMEYFCPSCDRRIQNPRGVSELKCLSCEETVQLIAKPLSQASIRNAKRGKSFGNGTNPFANTALQRQSWIFALMGVAGLVFAGYEWTANPDNRIFFISVIAVSVACICYSGALFYWHKNASA